MWPLEAARCRAFWPQALSRLLVAPRESRREVSARWPEELQRWSGVEPVALRVLIAKPVSRRTSAISRWPFWAARCRAVSVLVVEVVLSVGRMESCSGLRFAVAEKTAVSKFDACT